MGGKAYLIIPIKIGRPSAGEKLLKEQIINGTYINYLYRLTKK